MSQTYLLFDFGADEEKAQQARHKLESWKQAFRLDKKLLYKVERADTESSATLSASDEPEKPPVSSKSAKPKSKSPAKPKHRPAKTESSDGPQAAPSNGKVSLLVRLYFSGHEKLTEQRWLDRIPAEEPFKDASPRIVREGEPQFDEVVSQFDSLE